MSIKTELIDDKIVIEIPLEIIKAVVEYDGSYEYYDKETNMFYPSKILNIQDFAKDVVEAFKSESDLKYNIIHEAIDKAVLEAIESGSTNILLDEDAKKYYEQVING